MVNKIPPYLLQPVTARQLPVKGKRLKPTFLDKTILNSARAVKSIYLQAENSEEEKFIENINPHVKLISLIYLAIVISVVRDPYVQIIASAFIFLLYALARIRIFYVYCKIFFLAFTFGFLIVLPASLNVITPGRIIFNLIELKKPLHFWIYDIPKNIGFTENGFQVVSLVFLRVLNSVSLAMLVVFTTPFMPFIKSLGILGVPDTFQMIITLSYKYIFILSRTIEETYFALKSRFSGNLESRSIRKLISGRIFYIYKRSVVIYENTYCAMVSRGYRGKVILHSHNHYGIRDFIALFIIVAMGVILILL
jgi:cobalt/nickel transport system permease protein